MELLGRSAERVALGGLLSRATDGFSGTLVLRGEAGVGKTVLLDDVVAAAAAGGMQTARLTGVEPETQLGYAALHRFLLPFADHIEQLPGPQRDALRSTFGLVDGPPADRFLVALSVLTLLAEVASQAPLVCVVDDVQWLDPESAVALGFVARRLHAERVVMVFAVRDPDGDLAPALAGLPELVIGRLDARAAAGLLSSLTPGRVSPAVGARLFAETGGNPLALIEMARELSPAQLSGLAVLPEPLPAAGSLQETFRRRLSRLSDDARLLLAVAAAEPTASQLLLWRTARELGIDPEPASAGLNDLAEFGPQVMFRHPLVRSVAYHGIPVRQQRRIHQALAALTDPNGQPDRVAWHLGMAARGPDDAVAAQLEQAAKRIGERGGYAATVTFFTRAAELSADDSLRSGRLLAASEAALVAGQPYRAGVLLEEAVPRLGDPLARARATRLRGAIRLGSGHAGEAASALLAAAHAYELSDARLAREALLEALEAAVYRGWSASGAVLSEIARTAQLVPGAAEPETSVTDLLLDGFAARAIAGYAAAVPLFRRAIARLRTDDLSPAEGLRRLGLGCVAAADLCDDRGQSALAIRWVQLARGNGALTALPVALSNQSAFAEIPAGHFDAARACSAEGMDISAATGNPGVIGTAGVPEVLELAWRGREAETRRVAAAVAREAADMGRGSQHVFAHYGLAVLELGLGRYQAALRSALLVYDDDAPYMGTRVLPNLVEAAARCGESGLAEAALARLAGRALAAGTPLARGLLARSRALVASDATAEGDYQQAIEDLTRSRTATELARGHLAYGEWLRRRRRRREAREQLRTAHEMFESMGAEAFAERARAEPRTTGERAPQRPAEGHDVLTAQEAQIARLASQGDSNRDIAAQLFLSPSTVEYHLHKVFRKIGVASRAQLAHTMATEPP